MMTKEPTQTQTPLNLVDCVRVYAEYGYATFPCQPDKSPMAGIRWKNSVIDKEPSMFKYPHGMFGVKLKSDDLIIDIDPRNMKGEKVWSRLKQDIAMLQEIEDKATVVRTGGNGLHLYLRKPPDHKIKKVLKDYPGIEFLSKGAYVIGAGSINDQGGEYKFLRPPFSTVDTPASLLKLLKKQVLDIGIAEHPGFTNTKDNINRYIEYLTEHAPPAIEGEQGDITTFKVACRGRDYNLTQNMTWELMGIHYNPRCKPPWLKQELYNKVKNAYSYNDASPGIRDPKVVFAGVEKGEELKWKSELDRYTPRKGQKNGTLKPSLKNAVILISNEVGIQGKFSFNEFTERLDLVGKVPWEDARINKYREINDREIEMIRFYLAKKYNGVEFSTNTTWKAVDIVAANNRHHPVRQHIESLQWDGIKRLDSWLIDYCGASDTELHRQIGRKFLLAAVARIYDPGVKWDYVLVLEGVQGIGKSTVVRSLGGPWFGDAPIDAKDKDSIPYLHSHWIIELAEMTVTRKTQSDRLKNFISRSEDDIRMPYARERTKYPRQCVFIGTINPDSVGYLYDKTGNRRFWCVFCSDIDYREFDKIRDSLIAEAYLAYQRGESMLMRPELMLKAEQTANSRMADDPWTGIIVEYCEANPELIEVTTQDLYRDCIGGSVRNMNTGHQRRIAQALTKNGWVKCASLSGNKYRKIIRQEPKR